jgi:hypothetical protein
LSPNRLRTLGAVCAVGVTAVPTALAAAAEPPAAVPAESASPTLPSMGTEMLRAGREQQIDRHVAIARRHARLRGTALRRAERRELRDELRDESPREVRRRNRALRRDVRALRARLARTGGAPDIAIPGALASIAACESGGDPAAVSPTGMYRGKYQFSRATWAAVGGSGDPAAAPEGEQDRRAAVLYETAGPGQWPVCGR